MTDGGQLENVEFFKGKRVLVTGHTGYKGAWLAAVLNFMGADAAGYALAPEPGCMYEKICGDMLIHSMTGDLLDSSLLERTVGEIQPEIVIHLAGFGRRQDCLSEPVRIFQTNVMGSTFLLEALRKCSSVKSIVLESLCRPLDDHSSGTVCGGDEAFGRADLYAGSKICMENMAGDYRDLYFQTDSRMTGVAAVRVGNIPAEYGDMQTEIIRRNNENNESIHRLLLPGCRQPVLDILDGYLTVARLLYQKPEVYAGEWDFEFRQDCEQELSGMNAGGQVEELQGETSHCLRYGETERESCMRMISEYYGKLKN